MSIEICGDLVVPDELDAVRLLVEQSGETQPAGGYIDLLDPARDPEDPCPAIVHHLPVHFDLVEGRRDMLVSAQGLLDGLVRLTSHAKADFPSSGPSPVTLVLSRACVGVSCSMGQTCLQGQCELIPYGDSAACPEPAPRVSDEERCPPDEEENGDEDEDDAGEND